MTNIGTLHGPISSTTSDTRRGFGYGSTVSSTGLGQTYNMGDALSNPKGQWDKELDNDDEVDEVDIDINVKTHTSFNQPTVDFMAKNKIFPSHFGGLGAIALTQGHDRGSESLLREFISASLQEITSMSGRIMVKSSGKGDAYKQKSANVYYTNSMTPGDPSIKQNGYGQRVGTQDKGPYIKAGKPTTDGAETMFQTDAHIENEDEFDYNDPDFTTSDHLINTMSRDYVDQENVKRHNRRFK